MGGAGSIPPPPPSTAPAAASAAPTASLPLGEAVVVKLPERLQDLLRPVTLTGTVAGPQTPEGLTRIRTQLGEVMIDLAAQLSADKPVTLQIAAGQPPGKVQVFVNAPLPQGAAPVAGQAAPAQPAAPQPAVLVSLPTTAPAMPGAPVLLTPGILLPALVIAAAKPATPPGATAAPPGVVPQAPAQPSAKPAAAASSSATPSSGAPAQASAAPSPAAPAPAGPPSDAPVQLGGDAAHRGADSPASTAPPPPTPAKPDAKPEARPEPRPEAKPEGKADAAPAAKPATPQPPTAESSPQPAARGAPVLVQGATVALKIVSVAQPGAPAPIPLEAPLANAIVSESEGPVLHGTVAGTTPQGQPILATRQGMLVLTNQGPLPPGTRVMVALADPMRAQSAGPLRGAEAPAAKDWPALRQVMEALAAADPELARAVTNSILPQPNKKLGAALTFLLSAMRAGDARGWLGEEATSALERTGQHALLKQLEEEFRAPARPAPDAPADWKPFAVPMMNGQALQSVQVQIRKVDGEEGKGSSGREGGGSRFLLDLELSRFGPLQLDGLVRPQRFDLILRTHTPLPPELTRELTGVFADSLGSMGFGGALSFQTGARSWVKLTRAGRAGLGVTA